MPELCFDTYWGPFDSREYDFGDDADGAAAVAAPFPGDHPDTTPEPGDPAWDDAGRDEETD